MGTVRAVSAAEWADACSDAFVPLRVTSTSNHFAATLSQRRLSRDVSLTRVTSGPSTVTRNRQTIAISPRESILISLHRGGIGTVTQHDRRAQLGAGSAALYDASTPYELTFPTTMSEVVLQVPRPTLAVTGNAFRDLTARPLAPGPELNMLHAIASAASFEHAHALDFEEDALTDALIELVRAALTATSAAPIGADAVVLSMRSYITDYFRDPSLTPERVAAAHHISLRHAQTLFSRTGDSIAAFIRTTRLDDARRAIQAGTAVGTAAQRCGYTDTDSFRRAFKNQYGIVRTRLMQETR